MKKLENGNFELTREELVKLIQSENELTALESAGVDNWEGYDYRWEYLEENDAEDFRELAEREVDEIWI